tara:strand:- start:78948 stop:82001 length:3054 start_codon:yes stop_codon:yes gene_type:complete
MKLTTFALNRTRVVGLVLMGMVAMGLLAYADMSRNDMPPYTIRFAAIVTTFPGAGPERVESLVTDPIEKIAQEVPEVKSISSESRTGLSVVSVELREDVAKKDLQAVWDRLRRKIEVAKPGLPQGIGGPTLKDDNLGVVYGIVFGIVVDGFDNEETRHYAEDLRDKLLTLKDASAVVIGGLLEPRIYVDYHPEHLAELGLTAASVQSTIAATNILSSGGSVVLGDERVILEPTGNFTTLDGVRAMLIAIPSGGTVALRDIAEITRGVATPTQSLVRINGKAGVTLSIAVRADANLIRLGEQVDALLAVEQQKLPLGLELVRVADQDRVVDTSVTNFIGNLLQSVAVVFFVMLLMLGFRTGLVVASLIPMTMLLTLLVMKWTGYGLNQVTLAGLIMALGMLVDNAIVISEAILVEMERGEKPRDAAARASSELAVPLFISSLTTSAAFLAFFLADSIMGEIVGPLFVVITIALLSSWVLSMTMIPLLVVAFVRPSKSDKESLVMAAVRSVYAPALKFCLRFRAPVVVVTVVLFCGSIYSCQYLPFVFFPDSDRALVQVDVSFPLGTRIESTTDAVVKLERFVNMELADEVVDVSAFIGEGPASYDLGYQPGEADSGYAHLLVNVTSGPAAAVVIDALNEFGRTELPEAQVKARRLAGGGGGVPIEIRISAESPADLYALSGQLKRKLVAIPGTRNVGDNWGPRLKKFVIRIDQNALARTNLSNSDVAQSLTTVLTGYHTGEFREADQSVPIIMRADDATSFDIDDVRNLIVQPSRGGQGVPLSSLANIELDWQYPRVRRRNMKRTMSVTAYLQVGYTATNVTDPLKKFLENEMQWPKGAAYELGGEAEQSADGMASVTNKLPLSFGIILFLLIIQFNSVRKTFIVLATVPLGLIGVMLGLHTFQSYFGFFGFLGMISLAGIIINNAIVLLDRIRIERVDNGLPRAKAIEAACHHRMRPILLTTLTTALGLVPLYLGGGAMWEPMAVSIMIGLLFGTLITLVFVPVLYSLLFRAKSQTD